MSVEQVDVFSWSWSWSLLKSEREKFAKSSVNRRRVAGLCRNLIRWFITIDPRRPRNCDNIHFRSNPRWRTAHRCTHLNRINTAADCSTSLTFDTCVQYGSGRRLWNCWICRLVRSLKRLVWSLAASSCNTSQSPSSVVITIVINLLLLSNHPLHFRSSASVWRHSSSTNHFLMLYDRHTTLSWT